MRLTKTFALLACALLLAAASCARNQNGAQNANDSAEASPSPGVSPDAQGRVQVFRGTLTEGEQTLSVQMKLRREGDRLTGSYFYESVKNELQLRGTIDSQGNINIQESDASGAQTGVFLGRWTTNETGETLLTGTWSKPDGEGMKDEG